MTRELENSVDRVPTPPTEVVEEVGSPVGKGSLTPSTKPSSADQKSIDDPAELVRVGTMLNRLNTELQNLDLDEESVGRLHTLHNNALATLSQNLGGDLADELRRFVPKLEADDPTEAEVRLAHLQLTGWLQGLFQGIQMMAVSRQAQQQMLAAQTEGETTSGDRRSGTYL